MNAVNIVIISNTSKVMIMTDNKDICQHYIWLGRAACKFAWPKWVAIRPIPGVKCQTKRIDCCEYKPGKER